MKMNVTPSFKETTNALRFLSMDAVQKANSGHPGMPMGMADVAAVLFRDFMKFSVAQPDWPNRDRFILSAGHGSMLLYSLSYLLGYKEMTIEQLKSFRKLGSITPGHPEHHIEVGVETTTGPLGQGFANSVGIALAERHLNARFGDDVLSHYTYVIASDGDLMEGISHEAAALAGHWGLSKLIVLYDDNEISIDGPTSLSYSDDVPMRFGSYHWHVQKIDGHNENEIREAILKAQQDPRPSLICCKTIIGFGAPNKQGSSNVHGSPLGAEEIEHARKNLDWSSEPFVVPDHILNYWRELGAQHQKLVQDWQEKLMVNPQSKEFESLIARKLPDSSALISDLMGRVLSDPEKSKVATRVASGEVIQTIFDELTCLVGGSADLTPSNNTKAKTAQDLTKNNFSGRYIHYGVREHGMAAIMNGLALHSGLIPYSGTFLTFADYCRPSIRLAALMRLQVIHVMTHDSIGLGEDGPTHQPVEHLASLRAIPHLNVFRPADFMETIECWQLALSANKNPSILALSRQNLPLLRKEKSAENLCSKGAYVLRDFGPSSEQKVHIFSSGSEVSIAVEAFEKLKSEGIACRVISVPNMMFFDQQDSSYRMDILCQPGIRIAIEAGCKMSWERFIGPHGHFIGMKDFGASAPYQDLYAHFGITSSAICDYVRGKLKK